MAKITPKWRVAPAPTGRFSSFEKRAFPSADYANGMTCAMIHSAESYEPSTHKDADNLELKVLIAVWGEYSFEWRALKKRATSIAQAKEMVKKFLNGPMRNQVVHYDYREEV